MSKSIVAYIAHPFGGDMENLQRARRWLRWIYRTQPTVVPVAQWVLCIEVLDDTDPSDRARGMTANFELIKRCDQIWSVCPGPSSGRVDEVAFAMSEVGIAHLDLTVFGTEPPTTAITLPPLQWAPKPKTERSCGYKPPERKRR